MVDLVTDTQTVKVTTDKDGQVWILSGCYSPRPTGLDSQSFVRAKPAYSSKARIRIPGIPRNANLLLAMYAAKRNGQVASLEVCSPWCCAPTPETVDPEVLLYGVRSFDAPISVGGWRAFDEGDAAMFRFAAAYASGQPSECSPFTHPVGRFLFWIDGLDQPSVAKLLGLIIDPRWFIDPAEPDRTNKLQQFLGLDPDSQQSTDTERERSAKNKLVLACWKTIELPPNPMAEQFLWRIWMDKGGGWKGDLAASKKFISFLRQVWLMAVCRSGMASELFLPEIFFKNEDEVLSFKAYAKTL